MRIADRPVNPMSTKIPRGAAISEKMLAAFRQFKDRMNSELASVKPSNHIAVGNAATRESRKEG